MPPSLRRIPRILDRGLALAQRSNAAPRPLRYVLAVSLFMLALGTRFALADLLQGFPFLTFFPAVLLAAFVAGLGPGLLAAALSVAAAWYFFLPPAPGWLGLSGSGWIALLFFAIVLLIDVVVVNAMNQALMRVSRAERLLRGSERRLRRVLDNVFTYVAILDADGCVREVNEAPLARVGVRREDVVGQRFWQTPWWAGDAARQQRVREAVDRAGQGATWREDIEIDVENGGHATIDMQVVPLRESDGRVAALVASGVDVSERVKAVAELQRSQAMFRTLADHIPQLAWMSDAQGTIHWFNQRWFEYTGCTPQQMANDGWKTVHHPEHLERVVAKFGAHLRSGEPWEDTFPMRRHDGEYRWFLSRALPLRDERGRIEHWFGTNTDVTFQMETERALRESEERLLAREAALRDADRQKDTFLATLAHELRNPLAPIRSASQVIRLRDVPDEVVRNANGVIERQSAQLARLVDDLLDVSRLRFGNLSLRRERVDLRRVVESALETSRPLIRSSGHRFSAEIPGEPVMVDVDAARIAQCIANLVNNACKFTPPPGLVTLTLAVVDDDWVSVKVRDNGQGISRAMLGKVFELFVQERLSGLGGNTGLGIGLALTRQLVQMHGGRVRVRSDGGGKGAEFEVLLPRLRQAGEPAPPPPEAGQPAQPERILVVDDNRDAAESLQVLLELQGHTVFAASDGASALAEVARHHPRVVLLDIGLPDMDGYEVARRIRADADLPFQPRLVALTGWGQQADRSRAVEAGFDHHLTKPADPDLLEAVLRGAARTDSPVPGR